MDGCVSYVVAVRALCEFTARQGDLDLRFTPSPTALEGIAGHGVVTSRRGEGYQAEVSLEGDYKSLHVRGRADGYDARARQLEEIKTYRGDLTRMPANQHHLHWAQLRVYGHLLCQKLELTEVKLALVYFDIGTQSESVLRETQTATALAALFADQCERFLAWAELEMVHRTERDASLAALAFPHPEFRTGQRQLSETIYQANSAARCVMAQAPTGIGKTVGTLFPVLKAMPVRALDKVFYLTAKTPGRKLALDALATIGKHKTLRVIELVARDKACVHPDKACHGESCPLAKGFYDRLPAARAAASAVLTLERDALAEVAREHAVCPYYLANEMARWSDVIVGDYNYYFDLGGQLYQHTLAHQWRVSVLVDEAHNLVERARKMYSAQIDRHALHCIAPKLVKKALAGVRRAWVTADEPYAVLPAPPEKLLSALSNATSAITDALAADPAPLDPDLQRFYFDALHFLRLADSFGEHSVCDVIGSVICIRNVMPAPFLKPRFEAAHSVALFSATLSPWNYYSDALGLPENTAWIDVASPFGAHQLSVQVVDQISTRYQHRASSLAPIAALMARQFAQKRGNYLAFFSSFDYLEQVAEEFTRRFPGVPTWRQQRSMSEAEREQFLDQFVPDGEGIGFAVLGGAFGEGVDLPGTRLIGAFIATLGLPQMNPVNEQFRRKMGYDYAYLYPGIQKVVQAAGRVIRTQQDEGVVYLIDDRFAQPGVQALLPRWWSTSVP